MYRMYQFAPRIAASPSAEQTQLCRQRMSTNFIDPAPFESAMPADVRAVVAEAREGRGPAVEWLNERSPGWGQVSVCFKLVRRPGTLTPLQVGWLIGMTAFVDELHAIPPVVQRERQAGVIVGLLEAFAAGVRAGVPLEARQWKTTADLAALVPELPDVFVTLLPVGLMSEWGTARTAAQRLMMRCRAPVTRAIGEARKRATGQQAKRLDAALVVLRSEATPDGAAPDVVRGEPETRGVEVAAHAEHRLAELLTAWSQTHDPALIDVIVRTGKAEAADRPALRARSKGELETAWHGVARATDPLDVPRLVGTPWPGAWKTGLDRVRALARFPADPRIARGLIAPANSWDSMGSQPAHVEITRELKRHGDRTLIPDIQRLATVRGSWNGATYTAASRHLAAVVPVAAPPVLLGGERGPSPLPALWQAVYQDPANLDVRRVLADALMAEGDPRGEFIALQLSDDRKAGREAAALLDAHIDEWTGAIPGLERGSRVFERGFLTEARVVVGSVEGLLNRPELRTIERLTLQTGGDPAPVLDRLPVLRCLALSRALPGPGVWPSVRVLVVPEVPASIAQFPNIHVLITRVTSYSWTNERWVALLDQSRGLTALGVVIPRGLVVRTIMAWSAGLGPPELRISVGEDQVFHPNGWLALLRRDEPVVRVSWGGGAAWQRGGLAQFLAELVQAGVTRVSLHGGVDHVEVEVQGLTISLDGQPIEFSSP